MFLIFNMMKISINQKFFAKKLNFSPIVNMGKTIGKEIVISLKFDKMKNENTIKIK